MKNKKFVRIDESNRHDVARKYPLAFSANAWDVEKTEQRIREFMMHPSFKGYLCVCDGEIISAAFGTLQQYYDGVRYNLTDLFTDPQYQNEGYASCLLDYIKADLKSEGVKQIMLISLDDDLHNHFYDEKNGFHTRKELCVKRFLLDGEEERKHEE